MRKISIIVLSIVLFLTMVPFTDNESLASSTTKRAQGLDSTIEFNGQYEYIYSYKIDNNTYFRLRDIATLLSRTSKQFNVKWDNQKNAINLVSGETYLDDGSSENLKYTYQVGPAKLSKSAIFIDGEEVKLTAYTINNSNFFKLRDLGEALNFYIGWDDKERTIVVDLELPYGQSEDSYEYIINDALGFTHRTRVSNWASVSPVQQFKYKNEGVAFAFVENNSLKIYTPSSKIAIPLNFSLFGDVIADDEGNFYIIAGDEGKEPTEKTIYIIKYSSTGDFIKQTGFVGGLVAGSDSNTRIPFNAGKADSVIHDGVLIVNYAREMYNGHQSNNVIGVNIQDMSPYQFVGKPWNTEIPDTPYVSHSFNQAVIYSKKAQDFVFANHGDAYGRGFIVEKLHKEMYVDGSSRKYVNKYPAHNIFTFYLEANANYDMYKVNRTFAQLGGLDETSKGIVLVGASAKSISEKAKEEKQNLFIQIFDPLASTISPDMFVGGVSRSGATSFDINDNKNSPLTPVTDYGVIWLTNYTDRNVIAPQVIVADDKIVILWTEDYDQKAFYMILSSEGKVIQKVTSLGEKKLNSNEKPIYHNGKIHWVYSNKGKIRHANIAL